ncbi:hypothetical protein [Duganella hordei]
MAPMFAADVGAVAVKGSPAVADRRMKITSMAKILRNHPLARLAPKPRC